MKVGIRKPSIKKSISARTTGKVKRKFKKLTNPFYGKKGMGWINNPKKALHNKIYRKTTISSKQSASCLFICVWYPIYFTFVLMWWMIKYTFLAMWWICVALINGIIALVEWFVNRNAVEALDNTTEAAVEHTNSN